MWIFEDSIIYIKKLQKDKKILLYKLYAYL